MIQARTKSHPASSLAEPLILLDENDKRTGFVIYNATGSDLFVLYDERNKEVSSTFFADMISVNEKLDEVAKNGERTMFKGRISAVLNSAISGFVMVTEFYES